MESKLKFLILSVFFNAVFTHFDTSQVCLKENQNCIKSHCKKLECFGEYNYTCGQYNCAKDKKSCFYLEEMKNNLLRRILNPINLKQILKNFEKVSKMIKICPNPSNKWNIQDICIRSNQCFTKYNLPFLSQMFSTNKRIKCNCEKNTVINV